MATLEATFQAPTTYVPASFTLTLSPAEATQLVTELAPILAGNITIGNAATSLPFTLALMTAARQGLAVTAQAPAPGQPAAPVSITVAA
jgi:hypothetical protein